MTRVFLIAVFLCASFFIGGARAASFTPGESSTQNSIGDVVGPNKSGGSASGGGGSSAAPPDSSRVFLQGRLSSTLGGSGGANGSLLGQVTGFFDGLPTELQSIFLQALDGGSTSDILKTLADFALLQTIYNNIENISCEGQFSSAEYSAYMRNHFLANFKLSDLSSVTSSPTEYFTGIAQKMCESAGAGAPTVNPAILTPGPDVPVDPDELPPEAPPATPPESPAPPPAGENAIGVSDCSSNWASQVRNQPPSLKNDVGEIHSHIRAAAYELGMDPNTLAGIIWLESGGNTQAANPGSSATGLIQWIACTGAGIGMHNHCTGVNSKGRKYPTDADVAAHRALVKGMSVGEQMKYVVKYFKQAGWKPGMSDLQAYRTVHAGGPNNVHIDQVTKKSSDETFVGVLPKIEAYRCGGYDWNQLAWVAS